MDNPQLEGIDFGAFPEYGERPMRNLRDFTRRGVRGKTFWTPSRLTAIS